MLKTAPAVFAVGNCYQIMVEVKSQALMSVRIGDAIYYDETNGIMNSLSPLHRVTVPMEALNEKKEYTVCIRPIVERLPYFTQTKPELEYTYTFRPVPQQDIRIYHISDAHNRIAEPVAAAMAFGEIDLLILNGDVIDHSGDPEKFANIYEICSELTGGSIPVVFSRGNHDMRGNYAEKFADYTPNCSGNTYYTFRIGSLWGIVLDCGEDKEDGHEEYGYTVACHVFRQRQTDFIRSIITNAENEYAHKDVKTKLVIAHNPISRLNKAPFNIEADIYSQWSKLLKEHIKPNLMICGHMHKTNIFPVGGEIDHLGQPCTIVIAAKPLEAGFVGGGFVIHDDTIDVVFTDNTGKTLKTATLEA